MERRARGTVRVGLRILWFAPHFQPAWGWGGPVRSSWNLTRAVAASGADVTVVATNGAPGGTLNLPGVRREEAVRIVTAEVVGARVWPGAARFGVAPGVLPALWRCLAEADVLHVEGLWGAFHPLVPALAAWRGVPYVVSPRGTLELLVLGSRARRARDCSWRPWDGSSCEGRRRST